MKTYFVLACALLAGCGGSDAVNHPPTYGAGTRLKPIVFDIGGGAETPEMSAWFDTTLNEECGFESEGEGRFRCLPSPWTPTGLFNEARVLFQDADCSAPVGYVDPQCGAAPELASAFVPSASCAPSMRRMFRVTGEIARPTSLFDLGADNSCVAYDSTYLVAPTFYSVEALPPETFVGAGTTTRERAPGLGAQVLEAEDGSWSITGFSDPAHGGSCRPAGSLFEDPFRCLPLRASGGFVDLGRFVDPTCQTPAAEASPCDPHLQFGEWDEASAGHCGQPDRYRIYDVTESAATVTYETDEEGQCLAQNDSTHPRRLFTRGSEVDRTSFPELEVVELGSGRLRAAFLGFGGVPYVPSRIYQEASYAFWSDFVLDTASGQGCDWRSFSDGKLRCVPGSSWANLHASELYYAGPDCTGDPVYVSYGPTATDCPAAPPPEGLLIMSDASAGACVEPPTIVEVRTLQPFAGTTAWFRDPTSSACYSVPVNGGGYEGMGFAVSAARNPDALFAPMTRVTRN